jgi:hypothetical protein
VELHNKLSDLFIDVPVRPTLRNSRSSRQDDYEAYSRFTRVIARHGVVDNRSDPTEYEVMYGGPLQSFGRTREMGFVGAAAYFLDEEVQRESSNVVLEGSPGQGKSTVAQFICQVHRLRVLQRPELAALSPPFRGSAVRLPFRVDLPDFASWIDNRWPFSPTGSMPADAQPSLESFLAALVRHLSGGFRFEVADIHAAAKLTPLLVVLDGLDEVADIATRGRIVAEVTDAASRLRSTGGRLQLLVTTRPSAFANSPGFPTTDFQYMHLSSVTKPQITEYSQKWGAAKLLTLREQTDLEQILLEKLEQPHLRDLARNPMQLAILLTLINTLGPALPDRRTELYDEYIDILFARETEKNRAVRAHRSLLIDIHRYLAWRLHSSAEVESAKGRMSEADLRTELTAYLESEGHPTTVVDELFVGVLERVCALVQRVEGTYEFEVQPLREYFCARYLYDTAQYSPVGKRRPGTLPDRFDGIARNAYWLNVTRFFAGCFSRGELPSLVDSLEELSSDPELRLTDQPRTLATMLLSDWVFAQAPKTSARAVSLLTRDLPARHTLAYGPPARVDAGDIAPECGGRPLAELAWALLETEWSLDRYYGLIGTIVAGFSREHLANLWQERHVLPGQGADCRGIRVAYDLGVLDVIDTQVLDRSVMPGVHKRGELLPMVASAGRIDVVRSSPDGTKVLLSTILDLDVGPRYFEGTCDPIGELGVLLRALSWPNAPSTSGDIALHRAWASSFAFRVLGEERGEPTNEDEQLASSISDLIRDAAERPVREWRKSLAPWSSVIEGGAALTSQERRCWPMLAALAAGVRTLDRVPRRPDLFDKDAPLVERARYARLRAGNAKWWRQMLDAAPNERSLYFALSILLSYASLSTVASVTRSVQLAFQDYAGWARSLAREVARNRRVSEMPRDGVRRFLKVDFANLEAPLARVLAERMTADARRVMTERHLLADTSADSTELRFEFAVSKAPTGSAWRAALPLARELAGQRPFSFQGHLLPRERMPQDCTREVIDKAHLYTLELVQRAEASARARYRARPVGRVAAREGWFESQ